MAASESNDGPVLSLMSKRLRALRKKHNRILQMEEAVSQGKTLNKEQSEVLRSKASVVTLIEEYEKLRQPLSVAVQEELNLALQHHQVSATPTAPPPPSNDEEKKEKETDVEDLLKLLYLGNLFDVKPQSDFTATLLTRSHERNSCLTYDYVTDDSTDLLGEKDLDMISSLSGLVISRPGHSDLSHQNALRSCLEHAKLWLANSDQPIGPGASVTYAGLRERLNKIMASDYLTKIPEMKPAVEMAAAAGQYQVVQDESAPGSETDGGVTNYEQKDEIANFVGQDAGADQSSPDEESTKEESETSNSAVANSVQQDHNKSEGDAEDQNLRDESQEQRQNARRGYQNQRGGNRGGGRGGRGYPNGRGGRGSRGGGGYQNGRGQYYDQSGNYPRNQYNSRGRGGRGPGGNSYNNHGPAAPGNHASHEE